MDDETDVATLFRQQFRRETRLLQGGGHPHMRRRQFIASSGAATMWLIGVATAGAQQRAERRVGALLVGNAAVESFRSELLNELAQTGYAEGQNLILEIRSAEENLSRLPALAAELVDLRSEVIVAIYTPCAFAAKGATGAIPIVIVAANPLETGLVVSLARPDANITGISMMAAELHGKCVEVLHDLLPTVGRIGALGNAADPFSKLFLEQITLFGKSTGVEIVIAMVRAATELDAAFAGLKQAGAGAVVVQGSLASKNSADLALKHGLPAATFTRAFPQSGGLLSYGANEPDLFRRSAQFVKKILDGGKLSDMPIEQPTKFELVINLKTVKALGLTVPPTLLARADEVIE